MKSPKYKINAEESRLRSLLLLLNTTHLIFSLGIRLLDLFPNIDELFLQNTDDLVKLGFKANDIIILKNSNWQVIEKDLFWAKQDGHHIITIYDDAYPSLLKETQNPPLLLFAVGDIGLLKSPQLAIVGSRNPTPIGVEIAFGFAKELSQIGLVITSGLAIGIDAACHEGAIDGLGKTIAVMGTGLNHIYPAGNVALSQKIIASGGLLLSEFPLDAKAQAWHFPLRNRIISGLSFGTLVVEATMRSGSLITARVAGEQGRDVFAIPGSIYNLASRGCHHLIRQGAKLVEKPMDILEEFPDFIKVLCVQQGVFEKAKGKNKLDCEHKKLLDCMGFERTGIDVLAARANWSVSRVGIVLLELELKGLVKASLGGYLRVCSELS
ncbi:MAG: DNA-processing protein DprA [Gammaproteobacteria bacterium]|nr:DNA-processing protein DprA [Gammaproteobacteria bacterium]